MQCFICKSNDSSISEISSREYVYECPNCGEYAITYNTQNVLESQIPDSHLKASCVAAERFLNNRDKYTLVLDDEYGESINDFKTIQVTDLLSEYPENNYEVYDRILLNLSKKITNIHLAIQINIDNCHINWGMFYIGPYKQGNKLGCLRETMRALENMSYLTIHEDPEKRVVSIVITPTGWKRIAELEQKRKSHSNKAFIAMWFDDATAAYREAVKKAVKLAGYDAEEIIADEAKHNDYIMNKVLNMIDDAKFIIVSGHSKCTSDGRIKMHHLK